MGTKPTKPSLTNYLLKLAPDFSVLDLVEQYINENNIQPDSTGGYKYKNLFFYDPNGKSGGQTNFYRGLFKVESSEVPAVDGEKINEDYILINNGAIENNKSYYIIACKEPTGSGLKLNNCLSIVGVAF